MSEIESVFRTTDVLLTGRHLAVSEIEACEKGSAVKRKTF